MKKVYEVYPKIGGTSYNGWFFYVNEANPIDNFVFEHRNRKGEWVWNDTVAFARDISSDFYSYHTPHRFEIIDHGEINQELLDRIEVAIENSKPA